MRCGQFLPQPRHDFQRRTDAGEVARRCAPGQDAARHPLQVGDGFECLADLRPQDAVVHETLHLIQARFQFGDVEQWLRQLRAEPSPAHRRAGGVKDTEQRPLFFPAQRLRDLQIAPC